MSLVTPIKVSIKILFADSATLMCDSPHFRWLMCNNGCNGEITDNLTYRLRGVDIHLVYVSALEYPFAVLIHLLALKYGLTEGWSDG